MKKVVIMLDDIKSFFLEFKPEMIAFSVAIFMSILNAIAQPENKKTFWGSLAEVVSCGVMAVGVAALIRAFNMDENIATFAGCAIGIMGYKTTRKLIIFLFRGQIK